MHNFCCYSASENIDCHSIQAAGKKMQIILNALWTFIIIWQHFRLQHMERMQYLMRIYLFGISINKMLILQLKIFVSIKFVFHFDSLCNLAFISHFDAVDVRIIQVFTIFTATTPPTYVRILKIIIINHDFLPTPRSCSHVKSGKTHTHSHQDRPLSPYTSQLSLDLQ